jgi:hypothetical protein
MLILPSNLQLAIGAGLLAVGFGGGWVVNDWRHDSIQLAADSAAFAAADLTREQIAGLATELESKIASSVVTHRIIERGVIKEIRTNETIYRNVCITDAGRVLINEAAKGRVSSQSAKIMP